MTPLKKVILTQIQPAVSRKAGYCVMRYKNARNALGCMAFSSSPSANCVNEQVVYNRQGHVALLHSAFCAFYALSLQQSSLFSVESNIYFETED
ncbi:MAG: hypothetical protein KAJ98_01985, partial [Spirochaetaceae bacterium]|nr:hypothetical protein [Spirochaetaceae bacterium]